MNKWKRENDALIANCILGREIRIIYGQSLLEIVDVLDVSDPANTREVAHFDADETAAIEAARVARSKGLCQAWSLADGPNGMSAIFVQFNGQAIRTIANTASLALCVGLLNIAQRRN